jgi:hypothetical protein
MELLLTRIIIEESEEASLVPGHGSIPAFSRNTEARSIIWQDTPSISGCFWERPVDTKAPTWQHFNGWNSKHADGLVTPILS